MHKAYAYTAHKRRKSRANASIRGGACDCTVELPSCDREPSGLPITNQSCGAGRPGREGLLSRRRRRQSLVVRAHGACHSLTLQQDAHSMVQRGDLSGLHLLVRLELAAQRLQLIRQLPALICNIGDVLEGALLGFIQPVALAQSLVSRQSDRPWGTKSVR